MSTDYDTPTPIRIAQIGAGYWGGNLLRVLYKLNLLAVACDLDVALLKKHRETYPKLNTETDIKKVLRNPHIEALVIATPAATHYTFVKQGLENGKDIFVEKPLALTVKEGEELVALAEENKKILMVGHLLLYHPAVIRLTKMIKDGELGDSRYCYSNRLNFGKLRKEENVLWSFAPHDISVIVNVMGMPKAVRAIGKWYLQKNIPDITLSTLEFNGNVAAHIFVSWLNPFKEQRLTFVGSEAMAVFDDQAVQKLLYYPHKVEMNGANGIPQAIKAEGKPIAYENQEPLQNEILHFIECVQERKKPRTDGASALQVLKVLDACQTSIVQNGTPQYL